MREIDRQFSEILECKSILLQTDYHLQKYVEDRILEKAEQYEIPKEVLQIRDAARTRINELEKIIQNTQNTVETGQEFENVPEV